ncbi:MAG: helix-turn-helix domain-containing protein [Acidimicrobiia bacterium]
MSGETVPVLLTVEEAGVLLRIGRTKAYAMAREWRETDGRSGLPVIDLGHVLRVPRRALEDLIGAELAYFDSPGRIEETREAVLPAEPPKPRPSELAEEPPAQRSPTTRPTRKRRDRIADQLDLFDSQPSST